MKQSSHIKKQKIILLLYGTTKTLFAHGYKIYAFSKKIDAENIKQIIDAARSISAPYKKNFIERVNPKISRAGVGNAQNAAHAAALMKAVKKEIYPMLA